MKTLIKRRVPKNKAASKGKIFLLHKDADEDREEDRLREKYPTDKYAHHQLMANNNDQQTLINIGWLVVRRKKSEIQPEAEPLKPIATPKKKRKTAKS